MCSVRWCIRGNQPLCVWSDFRVCGRPAMKKIIAWELAACVKMRLMRWMGGKGLGEELPIPVMLLRKLGA